jgi:hypothetical protein
MVGGLEWVAWRRKGKPRVIQQEAIQKIYNTLKPEGALYLAIGNRYSFKNILGFREPHTQIRFISILPYFLANLYSKLVRKSEYRELTYSKIDLTKKLVDTGFKSIEFYYPVPGYQYFRVMTALEDRASIAQVIKLIYGFPRFPYFLLSFVNVVKYIPIRFLQFFWPSFCVIARK